MIAGTSRQDIGSTTREYTKRKGTYTPVQAYKRLTGPNRDYILGKIVVL